MQTYAGGPLLSNSLTAATGETFSSPAVGDLNGNGETEIVAGYPDGTIHVWNAATGAQQLVINTGNGAVDASPALVDLYHNGQLDILAGNTAGQVFVYNGVGQLLFRTQLPPANNLTGDFATPTVAYLDNTGVPWIVVSSWGQHLYAFNLAGQEHAGFPIWFQDTSWSSPTIAYLDGTGYPDIVVGYDCNGGGGDVCDLQYHHGGGYITVVNHDGQVLPGWPRFLSGQVIWSTPAVGDLFGNGQQEVVVGTGLYWPSPAGSEVMAFAANGSSLPGWPVAVGGRVMASPALGKVTPGGSALQVAVTAENGETYLIDASGQIDWAHCAITAGLPPQDNCPPSHSSPIIADVAGTGSPQVIGEGAGGWTAYDAYGNVVTAGYVTGSEGLTAAPTAVDLNNHATLLFNSSFSGGTYGQAGVAAYTFPSPLGPAPWPTFKQNMQRSGNAAGFTGPPIGPSVASETNWVSAAAVTMLGAPWSAGMINQEATSLHYVTTTPAAVVGMLQGSTQAHQYQVGLAFERVLGRPVDPGGLASWTAFLNQGGSIEQLRADLASSSEFRARVGGTNTAVVDAFYQLFLGRPADVAGQANWVNALNHGLPVQTMAMRFQSSSNGIWLLVNQAFQTILHRAPDPTGLSAYSTAMAHGLTLMQLEAVLTLSPEYFDDAQQAG